MLSSLCTCTVHVNACISTAEMIVVLLHYDIHRQLISVTAMNFECVITTIVLTIGVYIDNSCCSVPHRV